MIVHRNHWATLRNELIVLFQAAFNRPISEEYLDWRYADNLASDIHFAVSRDAQGLSASYSAFPIRLLAGNLAFETAMSMTTMTHPRARGKGLFPTLASELYADMATQGISFVWGFPNTNSHLPFIEKLAWQDIYEIPTLTLEATSKSLLNYPDSGQVVRDDEFLLDYQPIHLPGLIHIEKSKAYLLWRYHRNPVNDYQVFTLANGNTAKAFVVTKKYEGSIDLVDIQTSSASEAKDLLSSVIHHWTQHGIRRFHAWAPTHHFLHGVLERLGFQHGGQVTYFGGRSLGNSPSAPPWFDFKQWFIQMGDSDVY